MIIDIGKKARLICVFFDEIPEMRLQTSFRMVTDQYMDLVWVNAQPVKIVQLQLQLPGKIKIIRLRRKKC